MKIRWYIERIESTHWSELTKEWYDTGYNSQSELQFFNEETQQWEKVPTVVEIVKK